MSDDPSHELIALCCPPEYEHYGIHMHYVCTEQRSLELMRMLVSQSFVYPGSYVAIDLEGKLSSLTELPEIYSLQLGVPVPMTPHSAVVMYWDFQAMDRPTRNRCMTHVKALLDVPDVIKLIHAGKNDTFALKHEYGYELADPIVNTQVVYFEWMRLAKAILELQNKCTDPPHLPEQDIPYTSLKEWETTGNVRRDIGLNDVYKACGYPENVFKNQSSRSNMKQIYYALNDVAFLCQSYAHMMRAWANLKLYHYRLLTHQQLMKTPTQNRPPIDPNDRAVVVHFAKVLQRRGPMRIPELACDLLTWGNAKAKRAFGKTEGGVRMLVQRYPFYFQWVTGTFEDVKLKNAKVQLVHSVVVPDLEHQETDDNPWKTSKTFKEFLSIAEKFDA